MLRPHQKTLRPTNPEFTKQYYTFQSTVVPRCRRVALGAIDALSAGAGIGAVDVIGAILLGTFDAIAAIGLGSDVLGTVVVGTVVLGTAVIGSVVLGTVDALATGVLGTAVLGSLVIGTVVI